jgi:diphthine methyl ester synthase
MVLYIVGLGLGDERDITVRGLEAVKQSQHLFLEYYTSILGVDAKKLEAYYGTGVAIRIADRAMVESQAEEIYLPAKDQDVAFLVVGDPLCATTHTGTSRCSAETSLSIALAELTHLIVTATTILLIDLILRAKESGVQVEVVHNTSIMGGVASSGLQLYKFGYTVSIPFFEGDWKPSSFYDRIKYNLGGGMHTLCLLDIKVKEIDYTATARDGRVKLYPPRFMTVRAIQIRDNWVLYALLVQVNTAIEQLLAVEEEKQEV